MTTSTHGGAPPPPVTVAYLVPPSAHFAGIERVVHEIASGLAAAHPLTLEVHVLFCSSYDAEQLRAPAYHLHHLGVDRLLGLGRELRRAVRDLGVEVLVTPQVEASSIAWFAVRGTDAVVVPHLHGNPELERSVGATRRTRAAFAFFESVVARSVPVVLAVSPSLRDAAATTVARRSRVVWAKNPVRALGAGERTERDAGRHGAHRFVSVARLSRQKGQDVLLRAFALARPDLAGARLCLVGDGPEEDALRRLCHELGLDDVVDFAGYVEDPVALLQEADTFVLASRWEGFGVALVEALQCGLPLLVTDCDFGPRDLVTSPAIGTVVRAEDVDALAAGLRTEAARTWSVEDEGRRRSAAAAYAGPEAVATHYSVLRSIARPPASD